MTNFDLFALIATTAMVGVITLATTITIKFWPHNHQQRPNNHPAGHTANYRVPECRHRITASDPWTLILSHAAHLDQCPNCHKTNNTQQTP
jgi:hypothetical protein